MDQQHLPTTFPSFTTSTPRQKPHFTFDLSSTALAAPGSGIHSPLQLQQQQQEVQLVRNSQQLKLRPFSRSSFHTSAVQSPGILQYINPFSSKAPRVFEAHNKNSYRVEQCYKTVMCEKWLEKASCNFGPKCRFAHGLEDLRNTTIPLPINNKYKTRSCDKYMKNGICPYGERCLFIHPELTTPNLSTTSSTTHQLQHTQHRQVLGAIENKPALMLPSMMHRNGFATSLPVTFSHNNQNALNDQSAYTTQNRNLLPEIKEELRREREGWQGWVNGLRSDASMASGSSSPSHVTEQPFMADCVWNSMSEMVDNIINTTETSQ